MKYECLERMSFSGYPPIRKFWICVCFKMPENASESVDCKEFQNIVVLHIAALKRLKIAGNTALVSKLRISGADISC